VIILFHIDKRGVKREVEKLGTDKKIIKGLKVAPVADTYKKTVWNLMDKLQEADAYSMAQWLVHIERWIDDHGKDVRTKYERGEIVFIELGAMNFGYEASYEHPAIIIANSYNTVLIAPCGSKTYGKGRKDVIDIPKRDTTGMVAHSTGLTSDSGIGVGGIRWISKNRILNRSGKVTNPLILDQIDEYLLSQLFFHNVLSAHHDNKIFELERKQHKLEDEMKEMKSILKQVEELLVAQSPELMKTFKSIASSRAKSD
jgi:mRNA-degrading endonuclease toxin of MazEF toxin-antitoxin module